jgi:hypothetical protein
MDHKRKAGTNPQVDADLDTTWTYIPSPSRFWEVGFGLTEWTSEEQEQIRGNVRLQRRWHSIRMSVQKARSTIVKDRAS